MLEVHSLSRRYDDYVAVKPLSFTVQAGEIVGLLGHNGAGKTTLMKMLSGYLEPHSGSVRLDHTELATAPKQLQRQLGYLPENLPVYQDMLVADYLDYAANLKGLQGPAKDQEIRRVLQATDIAAKALQKIATLSRGYKQRVGVAQALLGRPRLLILDEPTNGLDPSQTLQMRQLIKEIARDATVILSTHIMQEVTALCDRVLLLRQGELVLDARLSELSGQQLVLHTSLNQATIQQLLQQQPAFRLSASPAAGQYQLALQLPSDSSPATLQQAIAALARAVLTQGGELYQLSLQGQDLETLFARQEVRDAA